ncbi:MAG: YceH family protein, partial [Nitrospiria bacterium]
MEIELSEAEIRVLGALMEKELTTPDYYPLSLNALKNACNQSTNRAPQVNYNDTVVNEALTSLIEKKLAWDAHLSRVTKYGQNLTEKLNMVPREAIVLALLMLRGPQTVGELRGRADRVHHFENLEEVDEVLENLKEWGLICQLPRQAGRKECRYTHCFSKPTSAPPGTIRKTEPAVSAPTPGDAKIAILEAEIQTLRAELDTLK